MRRNLLNSLLLSLLFCLPLLAQDVSVSGRVTSSDDGSPLPGVTVQVKGTTRGATTDASGNYRVSAPTNARLVFSFIGFSSQEVAVGNQSTINVQLVSGAQNLDEIVITAQGIERDKRSLGYSIQEVNGSAISQRSEPNVLNALQGKVAGVSITTASGSPGASTNINIRGITSFTGNNQPLIVVDGIIFSNDVNNTQNTLFGTTPSNRLADINPESIESLNVLKGPAAAVLYGSRASAGAIVITTKSGRNQNSKTEITLNSSYNIQNVYGLPQYQNSYGQGTLNNFVPTTGNSWGPSFTALSSVVNTQGKTVPYQAYPNNIRDFFKQGSIVQNSVNIASGDQNRNYIVAIGNTLQQGIIPNTKFNRTNIQIGGESKLQNGLKVSGTGTYVQTVQQGIPGGNGGSAFGQITAIPRSYNLPGEAYQDTLTARSIYFNPSAVNPNWSLYNETFNSQVDRFFGNFQLGYDVAKWLNVSYRVTGDTYADRRKLVQQIGAGRAPTGEVTQDNFFRSEINGDLIINAHKDDIFLKGLNATLLLGNNINQRKTQEVYLDGATLTIPGYTNVNNASVFTSSSESSSIRRLVGNYGQLSLGYNNYLFLELSGRADQSSTLPKANGTYFYPGASVSFVPTDAFKVNSNILSYAKVRASIAKVGRDADPYLLNSVYATAGLGNNVASINFPLSVNGGSIPGFGIGNRIGSNTLTPEFVQSYEFGLNVGLFKNRVSVDATYFNSHSTNQIFNAAISNSTGYDTRTTNLGSLRNKGVELVVTGTPIQGKGFKWDVALNYTFIRNLVESIAPGITSAAIPGNGFIGSTPSIKEGYSYGVIIGTANTRVQTTDPKALNYDASGQYNGQYLVNATTGAFAPGLPNSVISTPQVRYTAGLTNTFSYKGLSLSVLVDTRQGGQILSFGAAAQRTSGALYATSIDRDQPHILPGVVPVTAADGSVSYKPNNIQIPAQTYWGGIGGLQSEATVFDATVYRLREASLNYTLPKSLMNKTPFGSVSIGVSGRNLFYYAPNFIADPELNTQGAGNIQGLDLQGPPNTRNFGVNLRATL